MRHLRMSSKRLTTHRPVGITAVIVAALTLAACGSTSSSATTGTSSGQTAGAQLCSVSKPLTIPVIGTTSGPGGSFGIDQNAAVKLAIAQINAKGGIDGCKLAANYQNDTGSPVEAATLMRQDVSSALAIIGPYQSAEFEGAYPIGVAGRVPMVEPSVSVESLILKSRPWSFDVFTPASALLPQGAKLFSQAVHPKTVVGIVDTQDAASTAQEGLVVSSLQKDGVSLVKTITTTETQVGYGSEVQQIKALNPSAIVVGDIPANSGAIVASLRSAGVNVPIMIGFLAFGPTFLKLAGKGVSNVYVYSPYYYGVNTPLNDTFRAAFLKANNGIEPGLTAPSSYDAVKYLSDALRASGVLKAHESLSQARSKLQTALASVKNFPGITGTWSMGANGIRTGSAQFFEVVHGTVRNLSSGS